MNYRPPGDGTPGNREPDADDHLLRLELIAKAFRRGQHWRYAATCEWAAAEIRSLRARLEAGVAETRRNA